MLPRLFAAIPSLALLAAGLLALPETASATHFRYGHLTWSTVSKNPATNQYTAKFQLFAAFRRTGYSGTASDGYLKIGDVFNEYVGGTTIQFGDGDMTTTLNFYTLNVDPVNNWAYAVALEPGVFDPTIPLTHTYNGPGPWTARFDTCCRISNSVNAGDGSYRIETIVDFVKTSVSPTSTLPIIVQCPALQMCNFPVPAADPENQLLTYRIATQAESYLNMAALGVTINSATGNASWNTPNTPGGLYSAQFVIEKRDTGNPANLLTKSSVDFIIQVVNTLPNLQNPSFQNPTPTCGQQITIQPGQTLAFGVSARSNNSGGSVSLNVLGQPPLATFVPPLPASGSPSITSQFSFTPTAAQAGIYQMNFTAVDTGQQATCGYSIVVPTPNSIVSLSGNRGGNLVRLQAKTSGLLCGTPTYEFFKRTGGTGQFVSLGAGTSSLIQNALTGPSGALNEYYIRLAFPTNCALPSNSNIISFTY
ncbi:MAG TPA: hypothetical protein VFQ91_18015 [Bryobacteraceae bacterium]|nr:hypothetical protein [Bryobacteraceae bacterium]